MIKARAFSADSLSALHDAKAVEEEEEEEELSDIDPPVSVGNVDRVFENASPHKASIRPGVAPIVF